MAKRASRAGHGRRSAVLSAALTGAGLVAAFAWAGQSVAAGPAQIMRVDEVKPGMRGHAVTVFSGEQSDRFEIEVIDVVRDYRPGQDAILFDSPDPRMQHSGIVGGMSGSPIYIDGKLVGALAYGYRYNKDPIGGITPIENMLDVAQLPYRPEALPRPQVRSREGTAAWADVMLGLDQSPLPARHRPDEVGAMGRVAGLAPLGAPMSVSGFSNLTSAWLAGQLGVTAVRGGSGGGSGAPATKGDATQKVPAKNWKPGDSVSVLLIAGDNAAAPNGTVTWVGGKQGERLLAFGHPMFGDGPTNLPIADARVHVIIPSVERSVKISSPLHRRGTMIQDRQPAISLRTDIDTPMIPVTTTLDPGDPSLPVRAYHSEVANHVDLTPNLTAALLVDALEEGAPDAVELVATTTHEITLQTSKGRRTLQVKDESFFSRGVAPGALARSLAFLALQAAVDNDFEIAQILEVKQHVTVDYGADVLRIKSVRLAGGQPRAGGIARFDVELEPRRGEPITRHVSLRVPEDAAGQSIVVEFAGGDWATPYTPVPHDVDSLLDNVLAAYPARALVASIYRADEGVATEHGLVAEIPGSVLDTLDTSNSTERALRFKQAARRVLSEPTIIAGAKRLEVDVAPARRP